MLSAIIIRCAVLLLFFSSWLTAERMVPSTRQIPPNLCTDCPNQVINVNRYGIPSFAALRFLIKGNAFMPDRPLAEYTKGDCALKKQLRFGAFYFIEGNHNEGLARYPHAVTCTKGKEKMVVYIRPYSGWQNSLYDSIPFHPGRYELVEPRADTLLTSSYRIENKLLAAYYLQHEKELMRANPFAGCHFADYTPSGNPNSYVPATPADMFQLLLVHKIYISIRHWKLRPLAKEERLPQIPEGFR